MRSTGRGGPEPFEPHITLGLFAHADRGRAGGAHRRAPAPADAWPGRGAGAAAARWRRGSTRWRPSASAHEGAAPARAGAPGGVVALVLAFGSPVAWVEAALIVWDVAAGGKPTLWQQLTDRPSEHAVRWPDGEGDLYAPAATARRSAWCWCRAPPCSAATSRGSRRWRGPSRARASSVLVPELPEVRRLAAVARRCRPGRRGAAPDVRQWRAGRSRSASLPSPMPWHRRSSRSLQDRPRAANGFRRRHRRLPRRRGRDPLRHHRRLPPLRRCARVPREAQQLWPLGLPAGQCRPPGRHRNDAALLQAIAQARFRDPDADVSPPGGRSSDPRGAPCWRWSKTATPTR